MLMSQMTTQSPVQDARWAAVAGRDSRADGVFVYAVRSTGIYCRPSCPSRRPRPDRVEYFASPADAAGAGFRPCRRCNPDGASLGPTARKVAAAVSLLDGAEAGSEPPLGVLASRVGCSASYLQRAFVQVLGVSPHEYAAARRLDRFKAGLRGGRTILDATFDAGFGSSSRVYEQAARALGMTPAQYRRGGAGLELSYATAPCPFGVVLVAGTERGVSAVSLGDSADGLIARLRAEFPRASVREDRKALRHALDTVLQHINGRSTNIHELPLDIRATAFERRVWRALQRIPRGSRATYADVAAMIGLPRSIRAVARACAANPVAIVVPCHRVVPATGGTGGYRWGADRKAALLRAEQEDPPPEARRR